MIKRLVTILCCLCCCLALFSSLFFSRLPAASADSITVSQIPAMSVQSFYGSSFSASYTHGNNTYSTTFNYYDTYTASAFSGANIDSNPVSDFNNYSFVVYAANVDDSQGNLDLLTIDSCSTYYSYYVRGGVGASCPLNYNGNSWSIIDYPNTYFGDFQGICGNTQASSELADYYGYVYLTLNSGWNDISFRYIPFYSDDSPIFLETLTFENLQTYWIDGVRTTFIFFLTPFVGGDMSGSPPVSETTTTIVSGSSGGSANLGNVESGISELNSGIDDLNSGVDDLNSGIDEMHSDIVSGVSGIVSALVVPSDSLGDLVLDPIDTLPQEYDYDDIIDTAAEVIEDIPPGIVGAASLWGMLDMLFGVDSTFIWLIPLAVFMAIAAWVLYRTG